MTWNNLHADVAAEFAANARTDVSGLTIAQWGNTRRRAADVFDALQETLLGRRSATLAELLPAVRLPVSPANQIAVGLMLRSLGWRASRTRRGRKYDAPARPRDCA